MKYAMQIFWYLSYIIVIKYKMHYAEGEENEKLIYFEGKDKEL